MQFFDVVVVGAGPAGGHCARLLAKLGYLVLLVEQHEDFQNNNFSSAASPLETLQNYNLPESVVSRYWQNIEIISTNIYRSWQAKQPLGVVFDFAKLRAFLAQDVANNGGIVWLGCRYLKYGNEDGKITVYLHKKGGEPFTIQTKLLVDATGYSRTVIYPNKKDKPNFLKGIGIEYLIQVDEELYQKYSDSLIFFLGYKWSPQGYSWIFPMENNQLKVGTAILEGKHKFIQKNKPIKEYIYQIIQDYIKLEHYQIIDIHGSILEYSPKLNDIYYKNQIIAIGDTVSTVNFLGGEGIRYAMKSAEVACRYIEDYLQNNHQDFKSYEAELKQYFSQRWNWSEQISRKVYLEYSDARIDQGVSYLKYLSLDDIIDILFHYTFEKYTKGLKGFFIQKIKLFGKKLFKNIHLS
ncbi:NAD(P)/FAD-dependent oxidoreductase [Aphanothece hegewaldii CCALA 016]|uniref:NAD(P)/FAD-dependent oxidoreductase n=1 Tax=Aphanothece hegewaldii CCALA 016 TaxID=2107694 RepID=A0A2T1LUH1_9CHRO|nr:NAD(P)/FAD-dependent oxidoreductase [Aphanothece hegewaldii]PSF35185.1 NAD(P)/FAD-dependent oxidoreductase [Aphanothece hegewaldii CCALA 016]